MTDFEEKYKELYARKDWTIDDLLKLVCAFAYNRMKEQKKDYIDIKETIYGSGQVFKITLKTKKLTKEK